MRILMVSATYVPTINGIAVSLSNLKESLTTLGHDVTVLAPENPLASKDEKNVVRYPSLDNPVVKDYPVPLSLGPRGLIKLLGNYTPDIIHVHHPLHIGAMAKFLAKQYKVPLVFTYHTRYDLYAKKYAKFLPKSIRKTFYNNRIDNFCKNVDLIIAPSNYIQKKLAKKFPYQRIVTIPTGITREKVSLKEVKDLRKKLKIEATKKIILTVGRISKEKNQEVLINMMKYLDENCVLVVVGDGPDKNTLMKLAKKLRVNKRIIFTGKVEHSEVGNYYMLADCFVYSSITETQGIIFLEALSYGLPIVSVVSSAAKEWVTKDVGYLTDSDPKLVAESVTKIIKIGKGNFSASANLIASEYTADKMADKLLKEYESLSKRHMLYRELVKTGWQSWSTKPQGLIKYPIRNFAPSGKTFLPKLECSKTVKQPIKGWCSRYAYWWKIDAEKIVNQTKWFSNHPEVPIDYILIDDGWTKWGDWNDEDSARFPGGIKKVSQEIKNLKFKPGIWIAPFLVDPRSEIVKKHPEFLVRYNNKLIEGFKATVFDRFLFPKYVMDIRKKNVRKYLAISIKKLVEEDGFELIKLDFLYAPYFIPGIGTHEAGHYINKFLSNIKKRYPDVYTIACGCPFSPALGVVDAMRIGPDTVAPYFDKIPFLSTAYHRRRILLVERNIQNRKEMESYWNLDPDAYVCRGTLGINKKLLKRFGNEVKNLNGNIFLGDDFTKLKKARVRDYVLPLFK